MRTKEGPIRATTLAATIAAVFLAAMCSGCSSQNRPMGTCTVIGGIVGGLAGGAGGVAIANYTRGGHHPTATDQDTYAYGFGGGVLGILIGGAIGHALCDPEIQPAYQRYRPARPSTYRQYPPTSSSYQYRPSSSTTTTLTPSGYPSNQ